MPDAAIDSALHTLEQRILSETHIGSEAVRLSLYCIFQAKLSTLDRSRDVAEAGAGFGIYTPKGPFTWHAGTKGAPIIPCSTCAHKEHHKT